MDVLWGDAGGVGIHMEHETTHSTPLDDDGYVIERGVLSADEVAALRAQVDGVLDDRGIQLAGGTVLPNAAVAAPELGWLFCDPRIVALARDALGDDEILFTYEADLHRNFLANVWHRDTGEGHLSGGYFGEDPLGRHDCRIVKLALYLQDHTKGGGLHLRPASHRMTEPDRIAEVAVATAPGDVVAFDVRISHRGTRPGLSDQALRAVAKLPAPGGRQRSADSYRRRLNAVRHRPDRLAVYVAFGVANARSEHFAKCNMSRQLTHLHDSTTELPPDLRSGLEAAGVRIATL